MPKLKPYEEHQKIGQAMDAPEPSGVACTEKKCQGEMMIKVPYQDHYTVGKAGEAGAIKSNLRRARCGLCGWWGWV